LKKVKNRQQELQTLVDKTIAFGSKYVNQIEVYIQDSYEIGCIINLGEMNKATKSQDAGASVRCILDHRLGCAFTNQLSFETLKKTVNHAISAAKASTPDQTLVDFPEKVQYKPTKDTWDGAIPEKDPSVFVDLTTQIASEVSKRDSSIIIGEAGTGVFFGWTAYSNSNGISIADRGTGVYAYSALVAPTPTGVTPPATAVDVNRRFKMDIDYVVNSAVNDVILAKNSVKGKTEPSTVIFAEAALANILSFAFVPALRGENVVREKSRLINRIGDSIASKALSFIDNGRYPGGFFTSVFDGEGIPRQETKIIDNGKLQTYLWDNYWGQRSNEASTGNATRNLRTGVITSQLTNVIIPPGNPSFKDLISAINSGYVVKGVHGAHSSNRETGDFSVVGNPTYRIENGEIMGAVHGLMLAGNAFELIQKVDRIASDVRSYFIHGGGVFVAPSIQFKDVPVIAKAD
jgi:PmbA protein